MYFVYFFQGLYVNNAKLSLAHTRAIYAQLYMVFHNFVHNPRINVDK